MNTELTVYDMAAALDGEAPPEVREEIERQLKDPTSLASKYIAAAAGLPERREAPRRQPPNAPPPDVLVDHHVHADFGIRCQIEGEAVAALAELPDERRQAIVQELEGHIERMRQSEGLPFLKHDEDFHLTLVAAGGRAAEVRNAYRHVFRLGQAQAQDQEKRHVICDEHRAIVEAVRAGDPLAAMKALHHHVGQALERWYPRLSAGALAQRNSYYYDRMGPMSVLLFAGWVPPLEWMKYWDSLGRAVASAVRRGAELWYLLPADELQTRWRRWGVTGLDALGVQAARVNFADFREKIARELAPGLGGPENALGVVTQQVFLLHLDSDLLFTLVRPNQTLGHFRYDDGSEVFTQRVAFQENEAGDEIETVMLTDPMAQLFTATIRDALRQAAQAGGPMENDLSLRCLNRWLRGQPDSRTVHTP